MSLAEECIKATTELVEKAKLKKGDIVVVGCSTSEVLGSKIGTDSSPDVAKTVFANMSEDSAATVCALVSGDRSYLEDRFYDNIKASGVAHVMVVSGMHLSIIVSLALKFIEKTFYRPYFRAFIMFCTVIIMCAVCGFTNSILRAGITYIIMALGLLLNRPYSGENALGGAVTFILISSPFTVFNVGFQLSVLSTLGILAVALPICKHLDIRKKIPKYIIETTILSLSAMLLTLPVTIYVFGYVSNVSVITNLLISFPVTVILSVSVVALILSLILPFMSSTLLGFVDYGVGYINFVINYLGSRSFATIRLPEWAVFVAVLVILVVLIAIAVACMIITKFSNVAILWLSVAMVVLICISSVMIWRYGKEFRK